MAEPTSTPKIVVHWLQDSRAQRLLWLLEELNLPYEVKVYKRVNKLAPPELKKVCPFSSPRIPNLTNTHQLHPLGKSPIVEVDGKILAESGYIIDYLVSRYGPHLQPTDPETLESYKYLLHYTEASLQPPLTIGFILSSIKAAPMPFFVRPIANQIVQKVFDSYLSNTYKVNFDFLEGWLKDGRTWFCGEELSGADILLSFPLEVSQGRAEGFNKEAYPKLYSWLERVRGREAWQKAMERVSTVWHYSMVVGGGLE